MGLARQLLKWTPTALLALLVAVWIASVFGSLRLWLPWPAGSSPPLVWVIGGDVVLGYREPIGMGPSVEWLDRTWDFAGPMIWGTRPYWDHVDGILRLPIAWLLVALLPLAIGPFVRFRFRLWHWLAYVSLVAAALGFYLR